MSKTKSWLWQELERKEQEPFLDYVEQFNAKSISSTGQSPEGIRPSTESSLHPGPLLWYF